MKHAVLTLAAALALAGAALADHTPEHSKTLVLKNKEGVAILGYDPVAYFTDSNPVKGDPKFKSTFDGALFFTDRPSASRRPMTPRAASNRTSVSIP
jgi:hypothetical protein